MNDDKYYLQLVDGINYAEQTGSFNIMNLIKKSENVCVFGLGTYFREAFFQQNVKEKYSVNLLCDNSEERISEIIKEYKFKDIKGITVDKLAKIKNLVVIVMVGDSRKIINQLNNLGIENVFNYAEISLSNIVGTTTDIEWFKESENKIYETYSILENNSKKIYSDLICNRFNWNLSNHTYEELTSKGEYFYTDVFKVNENEIFVDCGAYNGDTVKRFLEATNEKFNAIYAFEMDEGNYLQLCKRVDTFDKTISKKLNAIIMVCLMKIKKYVMDVVQKTILLKVLASTKKIIVRKQK